MTAPVTSKSLPPDVTTLVPPAGGMSAAQAAAALRGAGFEVGRIEPVRRTLLDTFDGRLHAAGMRLEVRERGATELVLGGGGPVAHVAVVAAPTSAADLPAGPVRARLGPLLDVRALRPVISVTAQRAVAVRRDENNKAVVAVAMHDGLCAGSGAGLSDVWAAEVVAFEGYRRAARQAVRLLTSLGLEPRDGDVLDLAARDAGVDLRGFVDSPTVTLDPFEPAIGGFRRVLANLADTVDANWQGTVDDVDAEFLHDLRVAVRRTRSVLSHGKRVLPDEGRDNFGAAFRWLGTITSPPRDQDVYVIEWPGYVAPLDAASTEALAPVLDHLRGRRAHEHAVLAEHLGSARYGELMATWRAWLAAPLDEAAHPKRSMRPLGPLVASRLTEAQDRLLARGRAIGPDTPAEELHELRKDAKRLRYLLECFGGLLPADARKPFVQRLKALQDNLGEHQDTEVHTAQLKALSQALHGTPGVTAETLVAMGRLTEIFDQRRRDARALFAGRFSAYDTKQTAKALGELLAAAGGR